MSAFHFPKPTPQNMGGNNAGNPNFGAASLTEGMLKSAEEQVIGRLQLIGVANAAYYSTCLDHVTYAFRISSSVLSGRTDRLISELGAENTSRVLSWLAEWESIITLNRDDYFGQFVSSFKCLDGLGCDSDTIKYVVSHLSCVFQPDFRAKDEFEVSFFPASVLLSRIETLCSALGAEGARDAISAIAQKEEIDEIIVEPLFDLLLGTHVRKINVIRWKEHPLYQELAALGFRIDDMDRIVGGVDPLDVPAALSENINILQTKMFEYQLGKNGAEILGFRLSMEPFVIMQPSPSGIMRHCMLARLIELDCNEETLNWFARQMGEPCVISADELNKIVKRLVGIAYKTKVADLLSRLVVGLRRYHSLDFVYMLDEFLAVFAEEGNAKRQKDEYRASRFFEPLKALGFSIDDGVKIWQSVSPMVLPHSRILGDLEGLVKFVGDEKDRKRLIRSRLLESPNLLCCDSGVIELLDETIKIRPSKPSENQQSMSPLLKTLSQRAFGTLIDVPTRYGKKNAGKIETFIREYSDYLTRQAGNRGVFAQGGKLGGFDEKRSLEGSEFADWRPFSLNITSNERLVLFIKPQDNLIAMLEFTQHIKYTNFLAKFDPSQVISHSVSIAQMGVATTAAQTDVFV